MLWHEPISEALDVIIDDGGSLAILMACIGINGHLMYVRYDQGATEVLATYPKDAALAPPVCAMFVAARGNLYPVRLTPERLRLPS